MRPSDSPGAPATDPAGAPPPRRIGGAYALQEEIGGGATGTVWRALDSTTGEQVAIKLLRDDLAGEPKTVMRFVQERAILRMLRHPHIVPVRELLTVGPSLGLVMDLIPGGSLRRRLRTTGTLPPAEAAVVLGQTAAALSHAHRRGVVHRDLKPDNILLTHPGEADPTVRLTDFGVARVLHASRLTTTGAVIGTPSYLAPEVIEGGRPTPAADVYALGVVLFELLLGRPPFAGVTPYAALRGFSLARPAAVPPEAWQIIESCLATDPARRPTAAELIDRFRLLAEATAGRDALDPLQDPLTGDLAPVIPDQRAPHTCTPVTPHACTPAPGPASAPGGDVIGAPVEGVAGDRRPVPDAVLRSDSRPSDDPPTGDPHGGDLPRRDGRESDQPGGDDGLRGDGPRGDGRAGGDQQDGDGPRGDGRAGGDQQDGDAPRGDDPESGDHARGGVRRAGGDPVAGEGPLRRRVRQGGRDRSGAPVPSLRRRVAGPLAGLAAIGVLGGAVALAIHHSATADPDAAAAPAVTSPPAPSPVTTPGHSPLPAVRAPRPHPELTTRPAPPSASASVPARPIARTSAPPATTAAATPEAVSYTWGATRCDSVMQWATSRPAVIQTCYATGPAVRLSGVISALPGSSVTVRLHLVEESSGRTVAGPFTCPELTFTRDDIQQSCGGFEASVTRGRRYAVVQTWRPASQHQGPLAPGTARSQFFTVPG